jgi:hypothetical protein
VPLKSAFLPQYCQDISQLGLTYTVICGQQTHDAVRAL